MSTMDKFTEKAARVISWVGDRLDTSSDGLAAQAFYGGLGDDSYIDVVQRRSSNSRGSPLSPDRRSQPMGEAPLRSMDNLNRRRASVEVIYSKKHKKRRGSHSSGH